MFLKYSFIFSKLKFRDHWMCLFFYCFSFKQVGREPIVSLSPAVNSNWILKELETVSSCFDYKYTHLLTVQWTRNIHYCTQLGFENFSRVFENQKRIHTTTISFTDGQPEKQMTTTFICHVILPWRKTS